MKQQHIAIYSRKSRFTGKGESIENQITLCRKYIELHFLPTDLQSMQVYEDEGFSGGNLDRPQFQNMLKDAKAGHLSAIIVYRLDRVSRNIGDFANLITQLNDLHVSFISVKEQFDTQSAMGRAMMYIASVFSQLERETIADRIRDNMHELAKSGRWLGGVTPTGYASQAIEKRKLDGKTKCMYQLTPISAEISLVRLLFQTFLTNHSLTKTDTYLLQNGYLTKNGKHFSRYAIRGILTNPVYMCADAAAYEYWSACNLELFATKAQFDGIHGMMVYNRTAQEHGKAHQMRPITEWIVAVGKHEGIIAGKDWIQVQTILKQNQSKKYRKPRSHHALLSGLLLCGNCGDYMRPKVSRRTNAVGETRYTYLCNTKERSRRQCCSIPNLSGNEVDAIIVQQLCALMEDCNTFLQSLASGHKDLLRNCQTNDADIQRQEDAVARKRKEIDTLVSTLAQSQSRAASAHILQQIEVYDAELETMQHRLDALQQCSSAPTLSEHELDALQQKLASFPWCFDAASLPQKRLFLRTLIEKIVWDGETIHLYWRGATADFSSSQPMPFGEDSK